MRNNSSKIRIDISCDSCGGTHEIFIQSNRVGYARSFQYECPERHKPVLMPANAFLSMEAVSAIPIAGLMATIVE